MKIKLLSEELAAAGIGRPKINALKPDIANYKVHLFQPSGEIEASSSGVRHKNRPLADAQFSAFLSSAIELNADLVVTPEYSMPWRVLTSAIKGGLQPHQGELWALGCESIRYSELSLLKADLKDFAEFIFESLEPSPNHFLSPLAYVFAAPLLADQEQQKLVVVVQFKTHPMSDPDHFEIKGLQRGNNIYQFDDPENSVRLLSIICSDALNFLDTEVALTYDRALIIHIQLNPKPREGEFRSYRDKLFRYPAGVTELICLNWASNVVVWLGEKRVEWRNVAASAWYLRPDTFDLRDHTLAENHRKGLYYTWLRRFKCHALFFNYQPAVFTIDSSKVFHHGVPAVQSRRRGPQLQHALGWQHSASTWTAQAGIDDGFAGIVHESGDAQYDLTAGADQCPFNAERILALAAGKAAIGVDWYRVKNVDSCWIESDEIIKRLTFCQDTDQNAKDFRIARLKRCRELVRIVRETDLPPNLTDLRTGFKLEWSELRAQQNAMSHAGKPATIIYMGEEASAEAIEAAFTRAADNLHKASKDANESVDAKQRLCVWYRESGELHIYDDGKLTSLDKVDGASEVDYSRAGT